MTDNSKLSFVRIAWEINGTHGAGKWHDVSEVKSLESWIDPMNAKYGAGSHRLEYDDGQKSYDSAQEIIKDAMIPKALA